MKSPFNFVGTTHIEHQSVETDTKRFAAVFDLPTDDCPGSVNKLVVEIVTFDDGTCTVTIYNRGLRPEGLKDRFIGEFQTHITKLGDLLYGFARIKMTPSLEFI